MAQPAETFDALIRQWAAERPDTIALDGPDWVLTYRDLLTATDRLVAALTALGLRKGDRIAWLGKNCALYFVLLFAAGRAGIVMTPIGWRLSRAEAQWIAENAAVRLVFLGPGFEGDKGVFPGAEQCFTAAQAWQLAQDNAPTEFTPAGSEDPVLQLYTSGTTGKPKGAVLANRSLFRLRHAAGAAQTAYHSIHPGEAILVAMPCAHIGGTGLATMALGAGVSAVILAEFEPGAVLDAIASKGITRLFAVPAALQMMVRDPRCQTVEFGNLRHIIYGAAPMPLELLRECLEVFQADFIQAYGMTETTGTVVALPPEDHSLAGHERMRSAGRALPGVEVAVVDPAGNRVPVGTVGEVLLRSSNNMLEYWGLPEATRSTLTAVGWIHTGDAGYLDAEGYLYIHDRVKDMIISGGENVYPAEVENAIYGHPDVADVAVIGVPDDKWGEAVKACIVPKPGAKPDPASIIAFARERIAAFKCPKSVDFIPEMPRNPSGKILRRTLREPYWAGRDRQVN